MKRTEFLRLSAFAAVAASLPFLNSCYPSTAEQAMERPLFLSRLFDEKQIAEAGKVYLQKTPSENNKSKLVKLLARNNAIATLNDKNAIQQYLDNEVKQDFEQGKTVFLKGWVLSLTEARQCALYALMNG